MAQDLPTAQEIDARIKADVQIALPETNPALSASLIEGILSGVALRHADFYRALALLERELLLVDAIDDDFIAKWAQIYGIELNAATPAAGNVVVTGVATTSIPLLTELQSGENTYIVQATATISAQTLSITSLTRSGSTVTATTTTDHNLASGVTGTISGAVETDYNVTTEIIVTAADVFQYTITTTPTTPATGTILFDITFASVAVKSEAQGQSTNLVAGTKLAFTTPIAGADSDVFVDFNEVSGGTDIELSSSQKERTLERIQNPVALFNVSQIVSTAKEVSGVTRVFVQEITPAVGQVTIYFVRDDDDNIIPSGQEVIDVEDQLATIKPAHVDPADVIVLAPTGVTVDFTFSALTPNTATMQTAIQASLDAFFAENTEVGVNVDEDAYRAAIFNTIAVDTGERVTTFSLSAPVGDIVIASGEIPVLGTVSF